VRRHNQSPVVARLTKGSILDYVSVFSIFLNRCTGGAVRDCASRGKISSRFRHASRCPIMTNCTTDRHAQRSAPLS